MTSLEEWAGKERVFVGRNGRPMRGDAIRQAFDRARTKVDLKGFTFHDLRHTGQTLAAATGATLADLMLRLGHASPVAANRYPQAVAGRDREVAPALSDLAKHGDAAKLPRSIVVRGLDDLEYPVHGCDPGAARTGDRVWRTPPGVPSLAPVPAPCLCVRVSISAHTSAAR